jgi:putative ABC transport system ATP-binding protein
MAVGPIIKAAGLRKVYRRGRAPVEALRGVSLELWPGDFLAIVGPSGGGKSTLLHILGGIDRPTEGSLEVAGVCLDGASEAALTRFRRQHIGFVFQFYNLLPSLTAVDNVALALLAQGQAWPAARAAAAAMLGEVGIGHRAGHRPAELSGGEQQRVAIARAVVGQPALVLADEPTGDLDSATAEEVMGLMVELNERLGITFIVATHNQALAGRADRCLRLVDGRLGEG